MAISKFSQKADYEATATHELSGPDGEPLGIKVTVRSNMCKKAVKVSDKIAAAAVSLRMGSGDTGNDLASAEWIAKNREYQIELLSACVASIDWGKEEWEEGKGPLPATAKGLATFLGEEWISTQVAEWVAELSDFTKK